MTMTKEIEPILGSIFTLWVYGSDYLIIFISLLLRQRDIKADIIVGEHVVHFVIANDSPIIALEELCNRALCNTFLLLPDELLASLEISTGYFLHSIFIILANFRFFNDWHDRMTQDFDCILLSS